VKKTAGTKGREEGEGGVAMKKILPNDLMMLLILWLRMMQKKGASTQVW